MLEEYAKKRKFEKTPEPTGEVLKTGKNRFVVHAHWAKNFHHDFRLEMEGVLKSWAVPKGIPEKVGKKVLAIAVEDHPIEYADFEGEIPKGLYGAGTVKIWDKGNFEIIDGSVEKGHLQIKLNGDKLKGEYNLIKFSPKKKEKNKKMWLLFKKK
jgi:bifunctional non-homologous end joining protein LigD